MPLLIEYLEYFICRVKPNLKQNDRAKLAVWY